MVKRTDRGFAKLRSTRSFMVAMCTVVLLMLCSFSYAGPNNIMRDPSFESLTVGTTLTTSSISLGTIRFVNVGTASGQLQVISPGEDGNVAVKVSKTSDSDLVQIDLDVNPTLTWIPVQGGHTYRVSFWARTDDPGSAIVLAEAGFQGWTHYGSQYPGWGLTSDWTMYTTEWTAPASANLLDLAFVLNTPGSFVIDNISIEDVAPATNLMPDPSFESLTTGTTVTAIGANNVGDYIRFVNNYGASSTTGKLEVVSQAEDGGKAVKLSKVANDSVWMDLSAAPPSSWIPVKGGHSYRITYWARTDDAKNVISTISSGFGVSEKFLGDTQNGWKDVMPNWLLYAEQWTAPEEATHLNLQFWIASPTGSVVVDNIHVEEIIPAVSSLTGTVTSMLSGAVIAGANVSVSSGGTTTSTTTDANGVYTLSNLATGTYDMTVTAAGYSTTNVPGVDAYGVSTRNVSMTPSASTSWTVTDTFTRDPNTDLGHTEDANAIPWVKTSGNTNALISSNALLLGVGSAPGGASLGRSFTPDNFDLSVKMTWDQSLIYSQWSGIAYRQNKTGVYNQGYFLYCPYADGDGNATIQLRYNGTSIASGVINTDYMWGGGNGVTLRISVYGNCHKVWVNDVKVIDTVDAQKASGGYVGLFCDEQNSVSWDDLNISYSAPTNVNSITDAKALADGTKVAVAETLVATVPSGTFTDGSYYLENVDRAYGIKVIGGKASAGSRITGLVGTINTDANGERYIDVIGMNVTSGDPLGALGMNNKAAVEPLAQGMLAKIWGKVTSVAEDKSYFYVNDGSNVSDGTNNVGIRVDYSNSSIPRYAPIFENEAVAITGVIGRTTGSIAVIRPKSSLDVANTVVTQVDVTPSALNGWTLNAFGTETGGSTTLVAGPETAPIGAGSVKLTVGTDGNLAANIRTTMFDGMLLADITELSFSSYVTHYGDTTGRAPGYMFNIQLDDIENPTDPNNKWIDDQLVYDPFYSDYTKGLSALNVWQQWDGLNVGRWYSANGFAGMPDGVWGTIAQYLAAYPQAKFAPNAAGGFRIFMGYCADHWDNSEACVDNVRIGTKDGTTVFNFEP